MIRKTDINILEIKKGKTTTATLLDTISNQVYTVDLGYMNSNEVKVSIGLIQYALLQTNRYSQ